MRWTAEVPSRSTTGTGWPVQVLRPYPRSERVVLGRCAARSPEFGANPAAGGAPVIIGSAAGASAESVVPRARGELVERASNILAGRRAEARAERVATFDELRRRGAPALDPALFAGAGGLAPRSAPMLWVCGESLLTGAEALVPAGAVYLRHRPPPGCVRPIRTGSTGLAANPDPALAARHAVLEIVERDLVVGAWYGDRPELATCAEPRPSAAVRDAIVELDLAVRLWALAGPGSLACVVACVHVRDGAEPTFGARCASLTDAGAADLAADVAVYEALMVRWSMGTPAAELARLALRGRKPANPVEHAVYAFDRRDALGHLTARLVAPGRSAPGPGADPARLLATATGGDVIAVDTSSAGFAGSAAVVRVVAPGARQLPGAEAAGSTVPPHPFG